MSYEGYVQCLCVSGHYTTVDCYFFDNFDTWCCPVCQKALAWRHHVDITNGSFDDDGNRIDGHVELECIEENFCTCPDCGVQHRSATPVFRIPKSDEKCLK